jgi:hypothetical protein
MRALPWIKPYGVPSVFPPGTDVGAARHTLIAVLPRGHMPLDTSPLPNALFTGIRDMPAVKNSEKTPFFRVFPFTSEIRFPYY